MEDKTSGIEDQVEGMHTSVKENVECQKIQVQNIWEIWRSKLRVREIEERETQAKYRKYCKRKFPQPREGRCLSRHQKHTAHQIEKTRGEFLRAYNSQNLKHTEHKKY